MRIAHRVCPEVSSLLLYSRTMNSKRCLQLRAAQKLDTTDTETVAQYGLAATGHRFNKLISVRPEMRYEYAFSARPGITAHEKGS